ncbi:hypothetical protein ACFQ3W_11180 [Paenibacillus puldeungensis]|uniref:Uncharacterized protein n=1 Tax=Paenibacillus puldeungensis TaxID=696536 RepID=A0ABW3RX35_9BACL
MKNVARITPVIKAEIDPMCPVPEVCSIIDAVSSFNPGQEEAILLGIKEAIERRESQLKGAEPNGKSVRRDNGK